MQTKIIKNSGFVGQNIVVFLVLVSALFFVLSYIFGYVIEPGQMGVRQVNFGPYQGFTKEALRPGYHGSIPFYSKVHILPESIQIFNLHRERGSDFGSASVEVQTTDGSSVDIDLSVLSRFYAQPGKDGELRHGGPADLVQKVGTSAAQWRATLTRVVVDELRRALGRLSTSEFYNPIERESRINEAHSNINKRLAEFGIKVEAILLRRYIYTESRIDNAIFQKNLQDQEERLNGAASKLAAAKANLEGVAAEWDAKIATLIIQGNNRAKIIRSQGDLFVSEQTARGDLLVAKAQADIERKKAEVLANTQGSEVFVAKEMTPLLNSLRGGIVTDIDPYDLEAWMKRLGMH